MNVPTPTHNNHWQIAQVPKIKRNILALIFTLVLLLLFYLSTLLKPEQVELWAREGGVWGPILVVFFIALTQIIAPLSGSPGIFIGIKLYGYATAMALFYLTSMISAAVNFFIARRFGRIAIRYLVGKNTLDEIEEFSKAEERTLLVIARIFGYYFFDIISYAIGLTNIKFKKYYIYTLTLSAIPILIQYYIFRDIDFNSFFGILIWYGSVVVTGAIFTRYFYRHYIKRNKADPQ